MITAVFRRTTETQYILSARIIINRTPRWFVEVILSMVKQTNHQFYFPFSTAHLQSVFPRIHRILPSAHRQQSTLVSHGCRYLRLPKTFRNIDSNGSSYPVTYSTVLQSELSFSGQNLQRIQNRRYSYVALLQVGAPLS